MICCEQPYSRPLVLFAEIPECASVALLFDKTIVGQSKVSRFGDTLHRIFLPGCAFVADDFLQLAEKIEGRLRTLKVSVKPEPRTCLLREIRMLLNEADKILLSNKEPTDSN